MFDQPVDHQSVRDRLSVTPPLPGCDLQGAFSARPTAPCHIEWLTDQPGFVLLHPGALFAAATTYTFRLSAGVRSVAGVANGLDHHWDITAAPSPLVRTAGPAEGSTDVPLDVPLAVFFSRPMAVDATAAAVALDPPVAGTRVQRNQRDHSRFVIIPGHLLQPATHYTVTVATSATDEHHQPLGRPFRLQFSTGRSLSAGTHAVVLVAPDGIAATQVMVTNPTPAQDGEPIPGAVVVQAAACDAARCGPVGRGGPLTTLRAATLAPGGRWLAIVEHDETQDVPDRLRVLDVASGTDVVTVPDAAMPSWSPDGQRLAYASGSTVHVFRADTMEFTSLPGGPALESPPVWSPDGETLALPVGPSGAPSIQLADVVARIRYPVPAVAGQLSRPAISPDGSLLAVRRDGTSDVAGTWVIGLRGGAPDPHRIDPDLAPLGFADGTTLVGVWRPESGPPLLVRVETSGGTPTPVGLGPAASDMDTVAVSPSGRQIAYLGSDASGVVQAWLATADGTQALAATELPPGLRAVAVGFAG